MTEQWLSIVEYARSCNVSDMTVRRRIKNGKLQAVLKDGKYFIPASELENDSVDTASHQRQSEANVIRNHPKAEATISQSYRSQMPQNTVSHNNVGPSKGNQSAYNSSPSDTYIPQSLRQPLETSVQSIADTRALLAFCEVSLKKFADLERRQAEKFKARMESMECKLDAKNQEISYLKQQLEDMQLLVKIIEAKK